MEPPRILHLIAIAFVGMSAIAQTVAYAADPLPSWNDGRATQAIIAFVTKVTTVDSPDFAPVAGRIATFDNDGTLWAE